MAYVYVSIGSNIDRYRHVAAALNALSRDFGELEISPVYESEAVGFEGDNFLNLVAGFHCQLVLSELARRLREIEYAYGRPQQAIKFGPRTLDIDILTYDDIVGEVDGVQLPRDEIVQNAFVLRPLQDIAADIIHPSTTNSYRQLWQAYDQQSQRLWPVDFKWRDRWISRKAE